MRVFYIDPQSYNNLSIYDESLLSNIQGHDIIYFCNELYQIAPPDNVVQRKVFTYSNKKNSLAKGVSYMLSMLKILGAAITKHPSVVHVQWLRLWLFDYLFVWMLHLMKIKVLFTAHNVLPHESILSDEWKYRKYYHCVDGLIVHTNCAKKELVNKFGIPSDKVQVLFHGILKSPIPIGDIQRRTAQLKSKLKIDQHMMVFSSLGIQTHYKGVDLIVKVWAENTALRDNPDCMLLLIGRNRHIDYSPLSTCRNVFILDEMISDIDFQGYLHLSSLLLLPYRRISQSGVLLTAIGAGIPVLVSDVGGLTEPLSYGDVGWNIGAPTEENLARYMLHFVSHRTEIDIKRSNISDFEHLRQVYSWVTIGQRTSEFYMTIAKASE